MSKLNFVEDDDDDSMLSFLSESAVSKEVSQQSVQPQKQPTETSILVFTVSHFFF